MDLAKCIIIMLKTPRITLDPPATYSMYMPFRISDCECDAVSDKFYYWLGDLPIPPVMAVYRVRFNSAARRRTHRTKFASCNSLSSNRHTR